MMNPGGQPVLTLVAVDDDADSLALLKGALKQERLEIVTATDPVAGLELILRRRPEIVLLDLMMPEMNGIEVLERIVDAAPETNVVLITGHYSTDSAVEAIRKGACDYLTKPLVVSVLRERIGRLVEEACRRRQAVDLEGELLKTRQFEGMVGGSPLMLQVFDRIRRVAPHFRTVLVRGATGTGKELVATALHRLSPAGGARFAVCNCAAVVESLFESELFGHVKGAFTGASQDKVGLFEYANGGTVFLDEIGDMPLDTQSKLLRVLESGEIQRVGSPVTRRVDVRIVSATNRDLQELMAERKFREDLYYRLSMVEIALPRLAERKEDLPLLEGHFVAQFAEQYRKPIRRITPRAQILLARYAWPGNVRELKSVLGSACMMAEGEAIDVRDLPENFRARLSKRPDEEEGWLELADMERRYVLRVLESVNGNKAHAARILGIHRATIYRLLGEAEPEGTSAAKTAGES
jgi:DNA-binding NtrC family response regulator